MTGPAATGPVASGRALLVFVVVAYGLAWLVCLPLWLAGGLAAVPVPVFTSIGVVMMYTPTVAAVAACKLDGLPLRRTLGLGLGPRRGRTMLTIAVVVVLIGVIGLVALATSALLGTYRFDLVHFEGARRLLSAQLAAAGGSLPPIPMPLLVLLIIVQAFTIGTVISALAAFGEEVGWRGYLTPALVDRLGAPLATVVIGVIWGCWHAPLLLLGYNYPTLPPWQRLVAMSVFCTILAAVLGWGRTRSGSVFPAAIGHGAVNAGLATTAVMLSAVPTLDTANSSVMGWAGWPGALVIAGILVTVAWPRPTPGETEAQPLVAST